MPEKRPWTQVRAQAWLTESFAHMKHWPEFAERSRDVCDEVIGVQARFPSTLIPYGVAVAYALAVGKRAWRDRADILRRQGP